jgi:hypothetical protein
MNVPIFLQDNSLEVKLPDQKVHAVDGVTCACSFSHLASWGMRINWDQLGHCSETLFQKEKKKKEKETWLPVLFKHRKGDKGMLREKVKSEILNNYLWSYNQQNVGWESQDANLGIFWFPISFCPFWYVHIASDKPKEGVVFWTCFWREIQNATFYFLDKYLKELCITKPLNVLFSFQMNFFWY